MKLRVLFLKKKHIYYGLIIILLIIMTIVVLLLPKNNISSFSVAVDNQMERMNLTGGGNNDILYIKTEKNKYYIEIATKGKILFLEPDKKLNTLGTYYTYSPLRLTFMDISRDKVPEIFTQATEDGTSIQHAFMYHNEKFEDLLCNTDSIIGFVDSNNNKTPKILSGNLNNNVVKLDNYILINYNLEKFTYNFSSSFMGKDSVADFIKYIESLPYGEGAKPIDALNPKMSGKDLAAIGKLSAENCSFKFQNALFQDTKWDKAGNITEIEWSISFKGISNTDNKQIKNYSVKLILKPNTSHLEKYNYKIYSITLE